VLAYAGRRHADPVPGAAAVLARRMTVVYPGSERPALVGVELRVSAGASLAVRGPNGSGKSTLLKALAGLVPLSSGSVLVFGNPVGACHHRVAYVPQRGELDWRFPISVGRLVMGGRYPHLGWLRRPDRRDHEHVAAALACAGVSALAEREIGRLSGGQRQRVLIARALAQEADVLLLDEPFTGIDAEARRAVERALAAVAARGVTTILATHDHDALGRAVDATVGLDGGRRFPPAPAPDGPREGRAERGAA
jgi:manganese/zinc/iron transport system ATP- binding protein